MTDEYSRDYRVYFAYGPDINQKYIRSRCFGPEILAVARLSGYRLSFYGNSQIWDGAQETLERSEGDEVWGVVYKMSFYDGYELDSYQDVRLDGAGPYFHYPVTVEGTDGQMYYPLIYMKNLTGDEKPPSREYMDVIIRGAEEMGLPPEYIKSLKKIETKSASYAVPLPTMPRRTECSGCDDLLFKDTV
ncbi:MAG: gamma-glutamylcyclotransferase [Deferribacterales bacterium]